MAGREQDHREQHEGRDRDANGDPRVGVVDQRRAEREAREHDQGQRHETGQPFQHDRTERHFGRADRIGGAGDADDIAADRRRQHVPDQQSDHIVGEQGGEADSGVEQQQYPLPAPGRQEDADQRGGHGRGEQADGEGVVLFGDDVVDAGRLPGDHGQEGRAHHDPQCEFRSRSEASSDRGSLRHPPEPRSQIRGQVARSRAFG